MRKILTITFLTLTTFADAQQGYVIKDQDDIDIIKSTSLAVILKEEDEKKVKKLSKKPEELKAYQKSIADYNRFMKEAFTREWHFSKSVTFITEAEADKLRQENNTEYCLLEPGGLGSHEMTKPIGGTKGMSAHEIASLPRYANLGIQAVRITPASKKNTLVVSILPEAPISQGSMMYCVQQINQQINAFEKHGISGSKERRNFIETKNAQLKDKVLLLAEELISDDFKKKLKEGKLTKEDYPYTYKLVSYEELDKVIASKDGKYAYAWQEPTPFQDAGRQMYSYMIVDAADGQIIFFTDKGRPDMFFDTWHMIDAGRDAAKK